MQKKPSIAIYAGAIPSTTFIERLIKGLGDAGYEIQLFGPCSKKYTYRKPIRVLGYSNNKLTKGFYLLFYTLLLQLFKARKKRRLDNFLKTLNKPFHLAKLQAYPVLWHQPEIFHLQWAKGIRDWLWVQDYGMKLVLSLRGAHINYSPIADPKLANMYSQVFPLIDGFHAVSRAIAKEAENYEAADSRIRVVYSGLDNTLFNDNQESVKVKNPKIQLISVGRSHWKKGYSYALDACKLLKTKDVAFNYTIVGAFPDIELQYQIKDLGLEEEICLLPRLDLDVIKHHIKKADILVLPSVEEGVANVVLEAMCLGTTVLTTDCGGMTEVIKDSENGFVCLVRDSQDLCNKIISINELPAEKLLDIQANAKQTINTQHSKEHMVQGMLELYHNLLNGTENEI